MPYGVHVFFLYLVETKVEERKTKKTLQVLGLPAGGLIDLKDIMHMLRGVVTSQIELKISLVSLGEYPSCPQETGEKSARSLGKTKAE
jgi:hypothetical protein